MNQVLNIAHLNISGQKNVLSLVLNSIENPDILVLTETWLMADDDTSQLEISGYTSHHCSRKRGANRRGRPNGGITVLVRNSIVTRLGITMTSTASHGIVWITLSAVNLAVAACYFPPHSSSLYNAGKLHPEPFAMLYSGVIEHQAQGYHVGVIGDLNARIGLMSDLPGSEALCMDPSQSAAIHYSNIPERASCDSVRNPFGDLLCTLLRSASMVMLNGRACGDESGRITCTPTWASSQQNVNEHGSVIDIIAVHAALYKNVLSFHVLNPLLECDQHKPIQLLLDISNLFDNTQYNVDLGSKLRIYRPSLDALLYAELMQSADAQQVINQILNSLLHDEACPTHCIEQLTQLLISCARTAKHQYSSSATTTGQSTTSRRNGDAPWWDDECMEARSALFAALQRHATRSEVIPLRRVYKQIQKRKKRAYYQQQQIQLIQSYFSQHQKDFWSVFKGSKPAACPLSDINSWTTHFNTILNNSSQQLSDSTQQSSISDMALRNTMHRVYSRPKQQLEPLNEPISEDEVTAALKGLSRSKAADYTGLTAECLIEAKTKHVDINGSITESLILTPVLTAILNYIFTHTCQYPAQFRINTLTPILKPNKCSNEHNNYRGIAVGSIIGKVFERILSARANTLLEKHELRAPIQCGFRPGFGTLDGMFTLRHLIDQHIHTRRLLYCLFIDFEKAFDMVPRAELIKRCGQLGMHGRFLDAVISMYESIYMVVKVDGRLGTPIHTASGTKQGGELSPLLFSIFIEQLHELLTLHAPDIGAIIQDKHVPALMYADDVNGILLSAEDVQTFLDILALFCRLFGMKVNTSKTYIVIYRSSNQRIPQHVKQYISGNSQWKYDGTPIVVVPQFKYLGCTFHQTRGSKASCMALATAGSRAMHALLTSCRKAHITQSDFMLRLFNVLVEPVLSYGCQIWGPDMFLQSTTDVQSILDHAQEKVQLDFIRLIAGLPKCAHRWVTLYEFGAYPLHIHWLGLCTRFWSKTLSYPDNRITKHAMHDNIRLYLSGCSTCWTARFLKALHVIGVISDTSLRAATSVELVCQLKLAEQDVICKARMFFHGCIWGQGIPRNPVTAPSSHVVLSAYMFWVMSPIQQQDNTKLGAPHLKAFLPCKHRSILARLRIGGFDLNIHTGKFHGLAREVRICHVCNNNQVEDLRHFLCVCPAYAGIRQKFASVFNQGAASVPQVILNHTDQCTVGRCVYQMHRLRYELLLEKARNATLYHALLRDAAPVDQLDLFTDSDAD